MKTNEQQDLALLNILNSYDTKITYMIHSDGKVEQFNTIFPDMDCFKKYLHVNSEKKLSFVGDNYSIYQDPNYKSVYYTVDDSKPLYKYGKYQALLPEPKTVDISSPLYFKFKFITMTYHEGSEINPKIPKLIKKAFHRLCKNLNIQYLPAGGEHETLNLNINSSTTDTYKNFENAKEAYDITHSAADEKILNIIADEIWGVLYAFITILQLCQVNSDNSVEIPSKFLINDEPKYSCRAISIDTARNYITMGTLLRHLNTMEYFKMNVFHWHIVDSTSFPLAGLDDASLNAISQFAAYHENDIYTLADVNHIITHANERGIEVIIEIDAPGHSNAIGMAYPEYAIWNKFYDEPVTTRDRSGLSSIQPSNYAGAAYNIPGTYWGWGPSGAQVPVPVSIHYNYYYSDNSDNYQKMFDLIRDNEEQYNKQLFNSILDLCNNISFWDSSKNHMPIDINPIQIGMMEPYNQEDSMIQIKINLDIGTVEERTAFEKYFKIGGVVYPDLSSVLSQTSDITISTPGTPEPPSSALNLSNSGLVSLMNKLYQKVIDGLVSCHHFHIGADEDTITYTSAFHLPDLVNYLDSIVNTIENTNHKPKIILWQELLFRSIGPKEHFTYIYNKIFRQKHIIIHNWASIFGINDQHINHERLSLTKDISTTLWIQSPGSHYYLDSGRDTLFGKGLAWNGFNVTWQSLLLYEPHSYTLSPEAMYDIQRGGVDLSGIPYVKWGNPAPPVKVHWKKNPTELAQSLDVCSNIFLMNNYDSSTNPTPLIYNGTDQPILRDDFSKNNNTFTDPSLTEQILGGSLLVWTETMNDRNIDSCVWPKAVGGAINLWGNKDQLNSHIPILPLSSNPINSDWIAGHGYGVPTIVPKAKGGASVSISYELDERLPDIGTTDVRYFYHYEIFSRFYAVNDTIQRLYNINSEPIYSFYGYNPPHQNSSLAQLKTTCYPLSGIGPDLVTPNICNMRVTEDGSFSQSGQWKENILPSLNKNT